MFVGKARALGGVPEGATFGPYSEKFDKAGKAC